MSRKQMFLFLALVLYASQIQSQTTTTAQNFTVQVSTTQAWTDSGLDLKSGDVVKITATPFATSASGGRACDPSGVSGATGGDALPLPSAPVGALIVRLHSQGAEPILVGASNELHIEEASHLYLGLNTSGTPPCEGGLNVKITKLAPGSGSTEAASGSQQTRGQQLKSQLAAAAQVFMSGQFGSDNLISGSSNSSETGSISTASSTATPLVVSEAPLDKALGKDIDGLPRRVNDQFNNLGDMVNFVIVGSQKDVQAALDTASWHVADTDNRRAVANALMETYGSKDYLTMPMSTLYLFGRKQDFGYEMAEPIAMVASRHHFRIWKAPFSWNGQEVWVGAGTHDIGFAKDKRNNNVTHKIDPAVDGERDNIGRSLQKSNRVKSLTYYLPPDPVQDAKNATGDGYHSDGRMLVIVLQ